MRLIITFLTLFVLTPDVAAQIVPEAAKDRIVGRDATTGKIHWAISHASAGRDNKTGEVDYPIRGPVEFDGRTLYSIRGDLMTIDPRRGAVVERQQYPAIISELAVEDGQLWVELDIVRNSFGDTTKVRTPYKAGFVPGRGPWESFAMVAMRPIADVPELLTDREKFDKHEGKWTAVRALLRKAEERDPTNPMLPAYRGLAANADGDTDVANTAFAKAIVAAGLWHEKLQLCGVLERARRPGLAQSTCDAAKEAMEERGIRPEAMLSLIAYVVTTKDLRIAMENAVERDDVEAVVRIASYTHEMFPNVEAGFMAWSSLADWLAEKNDPRADEWAERARQAATSPVSRIMWGRARNVDMWLLLLAAIFLALPVAGFAVGLRRREEPGESEAKWPWLPRLKLLDAVVLAVVLLSILPIGMWAMSDVAAIAYFAEAPIAAQHEGYGSPNVVDWMEQQPESAARSKVLDYARHELEAAKAGKPVTMAPPDPMDAIRAMDELARMKGKHDAMSLNLVSDPFAEVTVPNATPFAFPVAFAFLVFGIVGRLFRRRMPEIADKLSLVVPGTSAGFLALPIAIALIAALLSLLTPVGSILQSIATPAFGKYFGLHAIDNGLSLGAIYPYDAVWPWIALSAALGAHVVTSVVARRRAG